MRRKKEGRVEETKGRKEGWMKGWKIEHFQLWFDLCHPTVPPALSWMFLKYRDTTSFSLPHVCPSPTPQSSSSCESIQRSPPPGNLPRNATYPYPLSPLLHPQRVILLFYVPTSVSRFFYYEIITVGFFFLHVSFSS